MRTVVAKNNEMQCELQVYTLLHGIHYYFGSTIRTCLITYTKVSMEIFPIFHW